jgi:hypothetical protein
MTDYDIQLRHNPTYVMRCLFVHLATVCATVTAASIYSHDARAQSTQWLQVLSTTLDDNAAGVAIDSSGNTLVSGYTASSLHGQTNAGDYDAFVSKYNANGIRQWTRLLGTNGNDQSQGVITDGSGNMYIAGFTPGNLDGQTNAGDYDAFVTKYDTAGNRQWTRLVGTSQSDQAWDIASDNAGNVFVTGNTFANSFDGQTSNGNEEVFITKYDSSGVRLWSRLLGTINADESNAITCDQAGNVYVAGDTTGTFPGQPHTGDFGDPFVAKYDTNGSLQWVRQFGTSQCCEGATDVATDALGNAYVTGNVLSSMDGQPFQGGFVDAFVVKFDSAGARQWTRLLGTNQGEDGYSISADGVGNVYVAGDTRGNLGGQTNAGNGDAFVTKYDTTGTYQWTRLLGTSGQDSAAAVRRILRAMCSLLGL